MNFKQTDTGSYVAGLAGQTWGANVYVTGHYRQRVGFIDSIAAIQDLRRAHPHITATLIEDAANGPAVIDTLRQQVPGIIPVRPDGSKTARMQAITPLIEAGNVLLPHPRLASWVEPFIEALARFPHEPNDEGDALSQLCRYLMPAGMNTDTADLIDSYFRLPFGG
jgi:predicted phage terminase large subunit-like protein